MDDCERFLKRYCERCRRRPVFEVSTGFIGTCSVMEDALRVGDPEAPGYPPEWVFDSRGRPTCKAFVLEKKNDEEGTERGT